MEYKLPKGIQMREPYEGELKYFKQNQNVAGMAADDDKVILNPFTKLSDKEKQAVVTNEASRIYMRQNMSPDFDLTNEQTRFLDTSTYRNASDDDRKATIAARLLSGDPSAGIPTAEQQMFVMDLKQKMGIDK